MSSRREMLAAVAGAMSGLAVTPAMARTGTAKSARGAGSDERGGDAIMRFRNASEKVVDWLLPKVRKDGSFGPDNQEMTCYHKSVYLFGLAGRNAVANVMHSYIKRRYMRPDHDFMLSATRKVDKVDYNKKVWGYSNGWFALAAHRFGRFDISYPAYAFLESMYDTGTGGFTSTPPGAANPLIDLLETMHVGLLAMYMGDLHKARTAAALAETFMNIQPDLNHGFYLRMNVDGKLVTDYPKEDAGFYFLDATQPHQFYFMTGYPVAFLATMYSLTGERSYLATAQRYFNFSAGTTGVYQSHFSHKLAWGASLLYRLTGESKFRDLAVRVGDFILSIQNDEGAFFADQPPYVSYDQSAECGLWLRTIAQELAVGETEKVT